MHDQDLVVFVVDDEESARESLTFLLQAAGMACRGFASGLCMLAHLDGQPVGCIITDIHMPGMDGIALLRDLRHRGCAAPVIVVSGAADVRTTVRAMKAGAAELFEKPFDEQTLLTAVRRCLVEARRLGEAQTRREAVAQRMATLTLRERQILEKVAAGGSSKEIGAALGISPRTVEVHRANLMEKMQAAGVLELMRMLALLGDLP